MIRSALYGLQAAEVEEVHGTGGMIWPPVRGIKARVVKRGVNGIDRFKERRRPMSRLLVCTLFVRFVKSGYVELFSPTPL